MSRTAPQDLPEPSVPKRSFWDVCQAFVEALPSEVRQNLPKDSAEQHDHYIYGTPKHKS